MAGSDCLEGVSGRVIVNERGVGDLWRECMEKLIGKGNGWDHGTLAGVTGTGGLCQDRRSCYIIEKDEGT